MASYPPSTARLQIAISSLLRPDDGDRSERSVRCQLVYRPGHPTYTVWARSDIREWLSTALAKVLERPFTVSDDHWILELEEAEQLLSVTSS